MIISSGLMLSARPRAHLPLVTFNPLRGPFFKKVVISDAPYHSRGSTKSTVLKAQAHDNKGVDDDQGDPNPNIVNANMAYLRDMLAALPLKYLQQAPLVFLEDMDPEFFKYITTGDGFDYPFVRVKSLEELGEARAMLVVATTKDFPGWEDHLAPPSYIKNKVIIVYDPIIQIDYFRKFTLLNELTMLYDESQVPYYFKVLNASKLWSQDAGKAIIIDMPVFGKHLIF